MRVLIITPTFNESRNIGVFVHSVFEALKNKEFEVHMLVVDDNSPDGTAEIVSHLRKNGASTGLFLLSRKRKMGLGSAYVAGFRWGLDRGYELFAQMDADLSHNPVYLPGMLAASRKYDFVVGSRYVPGGGIRGWGILRRLISKFGCLYAKSILAVPINDLTGGYNIWTRSALLSINPDAIKSEGYAFQIEMKYKALKQGFSFREYPIVFVGRSRESSKMSNRILIEAAYRVWQFRLAP
jgi:dolichol-phosphate mannosyltransferase